MYTDYYNFSCQPFENTPDPRFLTLTTQYREVLASLVYGVDAGKGFMLLAGDVGTGKTTLIRAFLQEIDPKHIVLNIINPRTTFTEIANQLAKKLNRNCDGLGQLEVLDELEDGLKQFTKDGRRVAIVIDEAHLLSERSLEDIRLLSNIEENHKKLVQIILAGQKELLNLLKLPSQKSLRQRINISRILQPLSPSEVPNYINHRLQAAGCHRDLFDKQALSLISKSSNGIPRLINQICDNALLIGYAANASSIDKSIIKEVRADMKQSWLSFINIKRVLNQRLLWGIAAIVLIFLLSQINLSSPQHENNKKTEPVTSTQPQIDYNLDNSLALAVEAQEKTRDQEPGTTDKTGDETADITNAPIFNIVTVTKGDTITSILRDHYTCNTETLVELVHQANSDLNNVSNLYLGQRLKLPVITRESLIIRDSNSFAIQYASFFNEKIALRVSKKFITRGWNSHIITTYHGKTRYYKVLLGPFTDKQTARTRLNEIDFKNLPFLEPTVASNR